MDKSLLNKELKKHNVSHDLICFDTIESTNTYAKELGKEGYGRTIVLAGHQSAGRGRMGRTFISEKGGIYLSILERFSLSFEDTLLITPCVAVGIAKTLINDYNVCAKIKWVNDIFVDSRKVCGILTESVFSGKNTDFTVIGIGINFLKPEEDFPPEISEIAKAIFTSENAPEKEVFIAKIISNVIKQIRFLPKTDFVKDYRELSFLTGKSVILPSGEEVVVRDIGDKCELVVEHKNKTLEAIISNDVSVKPIKDSY